MIDSNVKNMSFFKMHGLGNDFVVIDSRLKRTNLTANFIKKLGDRNFGVGFDQLAIIHNSKVSDCLLYTSPSPRDRQKSRMPSSA